MKKLQLIIFLFLGANSFSQTLDSAGRANVLESIRKINYRDSSQQIVDSCDKYLKLPIVDSNFTVSLYVIKARAIRISGRRTRERRDSLHKVKNLLFNSAIAICPDCEIRLLIRKYRSGRCCKGNHKVSEKHKIIFLAKGFKEEENSWNIAPQYFYGNSQWVGLEFSYDFFQNSFKLKDQCEGKTITYGESNLHSYSLLNIGYKQNISGKGWGLNFSPFFSFSRNWVSYRPLNFTYVNNGIKKGEVNRVSTFGYSPELGFQIWYLHVNVGYHAAFKKSMRDYEKFYFTAKFKIPVYKYKYKFRLRNLNFRYF